MCQNGRRMERGAMWSDLLAAASNLRVKMPITFREHPLIKTRKQQQQQQQ